MKTMLNTLAAAGLLSLAACTPAGRSPQIAPAPVAGSGSAAAPAAVPADTNRAGYTAADVEFMQGMIGHHAQALEMTGLVAGRAATPGLRLLAERIHVSQGDEIKRMQAWLRVRGEQVPCVEPGHQHGDMMHVMMPGMATPAEMERLAAANGIAFDRLFLELMIRHHQGALTMVADFFAARGTAQEPELFQMANDVDADQRAEIARMEALLASLPAS
jgi:uncharacterized protein (DUF305 family)